MVWRVHVAFLRPWHGYYIGPGILAIFLFVLACTDHHASSAMVWLMLDPGTTAGFIWLTCPQSLERWLITALGPRSADLRWRHWHSGHTTMESPVAIIRRSTLVLAFLVSGLWLSIFM